MPLKEVAGVFSRSFVVGFFIPTFFALVVVDLSVHPDALPDQYTDLDDGAQILVAGAVAILGGLLLWGLQYEVVRLFEGYALRDLALRRPRVFGGLYRRAIARQRRRHDELTRLKESPTRSPERTEAMKTIDREYPHDAEDLLPTRLGNRIRAFEWHPRPRYDLNGIYVYPRIAPLLTETEVQLDTDARTDLAFFLNLALLSALTGIYVLVDSVWHGWWDDAEVVLALALPTLAFLAAYSWAIGAAERWGDTVRSSFDLHRLELYDKLGLRRPSTRAEEQAAARAVNRLLLFAEPLPDDVRAAPPPTDPTDDGGSAT